MRNQHTQCVRARGRHVRGLHGSGICLEAICSPEAVYAVFDLVLATVRKCNADYAERWNKVHVTVTKRLPAEMLVECVKVLEVPDRHRVNQVSRAWRSITATPSVWAKICETEDPYWTKSGPMCVVKRLETQLVKSRAALLDIKWDTQTTPVASECAALLAAHMWRVQHLSVRTTMHLLAALLDMPTPWLESLRVRQTTYLDVFTIPTGICSGEQSQLQTLHLDSFVFPGGMSPMPHLRVFSGIAVRGTHTQSLFRYFPQLVSLSLHIADGQALPTGPYPTTLRSAKLTWVNTLHWDHLEHDITHDIRVLKLSCGRTVDVPLQLFTRNNPVASPWTLELDPTSEICTMSDINRKYTFGCRGVTRSWYDFMQSQHSSLVTASSTLSSMVMPLPIFYSFLGVPTDLPALRQVKVFAHYRDDVFYPTTSRLVGASPIRAPNLAEFTMQLIYVPERRGVRWFARELHRVIRKLFCYDATRLNRISLISAGGRFHEEVLYHNWLRTLELAEVVHVASINSPGADLPSWPDEEYIGNEAYEESIQDLDETNPDWDPALDDQLNSDIEWQYWYEEDRGDESPRGPEELGYWG